MCFGCVNGAAGAAGFVQVYIYSNLVTMLKPMKASFYELIASTQYLVFITNRAYYSYLRMLN